MVGHRWDAACSALRRFLARNQITLRLADARRAGARDALARRVARRTTTARCCGSPTARCSADPRRATLPSASACRRAPASPEYDTIIIGGGPAGLAAAVYGASEGLRTIVVEREAPGGQAGTSSRIENYLGFPSGVSGDELASRALQQARRLGAEILVTRSVAAHRSGDARGRASTATTSSGRGRSFSPPASRGAAWRSTASTG